MLKRTGFKCCVHRGVGRIYKKGWRIGDMLATPASPQRRNAEIFLRFDGRA